jgi:hypothetical protein
MMRLLDRLGLDFESVDTVKARDGRWVLPEVNRRRTSTPSSAARGCPSRAPSPTCSSAEFPAREARNVCATKYAASEAAAIVLAKAAT